MTHGNFLIHQSVLAKQATLLLSWLYFFVLLRCNVFIGKLQLNSPEVPITAIIVLQMLSFLKIVYD